MEMIKVRIDGVEVEVPAGTTALKLLELLI